MPELPEVETTIRYLRDNLINKVVTNFWVSNGGERQLNAEVLKYQQLLLNNSLQQLNRHGKWMLFQFDQTQIIGHLRMSGRYKIATNVIDHPHNRFQLQFSDGTILNYLDQRRFGTFHIAESLDMSEKLGPDALEITTADLFTRLQKTKKPIYSALLDQAIIAGLGNIYVNESLHISGIHPLTPANKLSGSQVEALLDNTKQLLETAIKFKGTTLIDNLYQDPEGKNGEFAKLLQVYGKKKDPHIQVFKIGGRSVFVHDTTILV